MTSLVETFVDEYLKQIDFYQEAARLCAQQCEKLLDVNGIRAMVTYRAKRAERLRDKIMKRSSEKNYSCHADIRDDIVDFAGVRAALYFPADSEKFDKLVNDSFIVMNSKKFPDSRTLHAKKRFTGYHATHYRVQLRTDNLSDTQKRYASTLIEVQVASVLMHAWSEVEHDLIYKPLTGELSDEEFAILDQINGLVISGEIALEGLQRAVETRVGRRGSAFTNHYELAAFLYEEIRSVSSHHTTVEPIMGRVDTLLDFLRKAELNTPDAIRTYVRILDQDIEDQPISDRVADRILEDHGNLYNDFLEIKEKASRRSPYSGADLFTHSTELVGAFISKWITFERFMRRFLRDHEQVSSTTHFTSTARWMHLLELNQVTLNRTRHLRDLRNGLVHGVRMPDEAELRAAIGDFDEVFAALQESSDPRIKAALNWAGSGEDDSGPNSTRADRPQVNQLISTALVPLTSKARL